MTAPQWFSGPPPAVGWWPASATRNFLDLYRWWDGSEWSAAVFRDSDANEAQALARESFRARREVYWRHWSLSIDGTDGKGAHE